MGTQEIIFLGLSALAICCALGVILSRNPINSVLFLIMTFFAISGHYILLKASATMIPGGRMAVTVLWKKH